MASQLRGDITRGSPATRLWVTGTEMNLRPGLQSLAGKLHGLRSGDTVQQAGVQHPMLLEPMGHAGAKMPSARAITPRSFIFDPSSHLPPQP